MRKHDAALVALVTSIPALTTKFFPGITPGAVATPYAVFYAQSGRDESDRVAGPASVQSPRWTIHCVGSTQEQAQWVNEQIKAKLVVNGFGVVPTIAGEKPGRFWFDNPIPVQRDDDSTPPLFYAVAECGFSSDLI